MSVPCGLLPGSQGECGGSAGPVCGCLGALKTAVGDRTFWGSNPSGCPARLTSPLQSHLGPADQIKPPQGGGCEDTQQAGLSRHPARHSGVWTGPIHAAAGPLRAAVRGSEHGAARRGRVRRVLVWCVRGFIRLLLRGRPVCCARFVRRVGLGSGGGWGLRSEKMSEARRRASVASAGTGEGVGK